MHLAQYYIFIQKYPKNVENHFYNKIKYSLKKLYIFYLIFLVTIICALKNVGVL